MKSKLPDKFATDKYDQVATKINFIIDYLAERDKPIESDGIKPEEQPERSCGNCGMKQDFNDCVCWYCIKDLKYVNWQPKQPNSTTCSRCNKKYNIVTDKTGWIYCPFCGDMKGYDPKIVNIQPENYNIFSEKTTTATLPSPIKCDKDWKQLWKEAVQYYTTIKYENCGHPLYPGMPNTRAHKQDVSELKCKYELALQAAEKRIKELEEWGGNGIENNCKHILEQAKRIKELEAEIAITNDILRVANLHSEQKDKRIKELEESLRRYAEGD